MILVDTSVWIDHLHEADATLIGLLEAPHVCIHPMVVTELALGSIRHRDRVLALLDSLPAVLSGTESEVRQLVERRGLHGTGLSVVDAHLLAAVLMSPGTTLWSRDRRLRAAAHELGVGAEL